MTLILIFSAVIPPITAQAKDMGYLVLTQTEKDSPWTAYTGIARGISRGGAEINIREISKALGINYESLDNGFKLSRGDKSLQFTYGKTSVKYTNGSKSSTKYPPVPLDSISIYYGILNYLSVHVQYYTKLEAEAMGI